VWAPLSWHTTCQSSSTAYRQLDNNPLNYSESQKSVLWQETVCTSCWLWDNAPNMIVVLGASVCLGVGCYNLVLLSLGKPHSPKYFSIVIYVSPLICKLITNWFSNTVGTIHLDSKRMHFTNWFTSPHLENSVWLGHMLPIILYSQSYPLDPDRYLYQYTEVESLYSLNGWLNLLLRTAQLYVVHLLC